MLLAGTEHLNFSQHNGRSPFIEIYYLRFTDLEQRIGIWYQQGLLCRKDQAAETELWLVLYDLEDPSRNLALRETRPLTEARIEKDIFYFAVAGGELYHKGTHGKIANADQSLEWQLKWQPCEKAYRHYPGRVFYHIEFPATKVVSPNPDIKISGWLRWGERTYQFDEVAGQQSHLWGVQLAESWTWGQVNLFEGNGHNFFEGLSAQVRAGKRLLPPLTVFRVVVDGKEYHFNRPWQWLRNRSHGHVDRWHFDGRKGRLRIVGDAFVEPQQIIGVTLTNTDGSPRYCYHTENARLQLQLYKKQKKEWTLVKTLNSQPAMAYELVTSEALPDVPLRI